MLCLGLGGTLARAVSRKLALWWPALAFVYISMPLLSLLLFQSVFGIGQRNSIIVEYDNDSVALKVEFFLGDSSKESLCNLM